MYAGGDIQISLDKSQTRQKNGVACGVDLIDSSYAARQSSKLVDAAKPLEFATANGITSASAQVPVRISSLGEKASPYVLANTVNVLSLGRRCVKYGYSFHWPSFSTEPYLISPKGNVSS